MEKIELKIQKQTKPPRMASIEETIQLARLQQAVTTSALYERKHNKKALKVLTVAAYILFVSMAAIILSFYYVFIWDPTSKILAPRNATNCDDTPQKIVIPESLAIQLANSTEISAENFFKSIYRRYQRQQQQEERKRRLTKTTHLPNIPDLIASKLIAQNSDNIVDYHSNRNETNLLEEDRTSTTDMADLILSAKEQNSYVDDEDMGNEYDDIESSGANRLRMNDTIVSKNYNDNENSYDND